MKYGKLTVENFGPIKKAEIDLKQLMIFIGPQGSGKSALMKLISAIYEFFATHTLNKLEMNGSEWPFFKELLNRQNIDNYLKSDTYIKFDSFDNQLEYKIKRFDLQFGEYQLPNLPYYMPAERIYFSTFSNMIFNFLKHETPIPNLLSNFGSYLENARKNIQNLDVKFLDIEYKFENNENRVYYDDKNFVLLSESSSGMQSVIPMALIIENLTNFPTNYSIYKSNPKEFAKGIYAVFIEEPELNLFPTAQKSFVEFIIKKLIKNYQNSHSVIMATHSPYILTAINNLIEAGNVHKKDNSLEKKIAEIIPKDCWLDFDEVSAYYIENGKTKNILNTAERSITADAIDQVSETIALDFDKLLNLEYPS